MEKNFRASLLLSANQSYFFSRDGQRENQLKRLKELTETNDLLPGFENNCRRRHGCVHQLRRTIKNIPDNINPRRHTNASLLDIRQAIDRVPLIMPSNRSLLTSYFRSELVKRSPGPNQSSRLHAFSSLLQSSICRIFLVTLESWFLFADNFALFHSDGVISHVVNPLQNYLHSLQRYQSE